MKFNKKFQVIVDGIEELEKLIQNTPYNAETQVVRGVYYDRLDKSKAEYKALGKTYHPEVGDYVTEIGYTDRRAWEVIKVTAQTATVRRCKVTRLDDPEIIPGGFAGHCTNQRDIRYEIEPDVDGSTLIIRKTKNGWSRHKVAFLVCGGHEFYDYNF